MLTRTPSEIHCNYVQQPDCVSAASGQVMPRTLFSLSSTVPFRYQVPEAFNDHVIATVGISGNKNPCSGDLRKLSLAERYRCCLWEGGLPAGFTNPKRTTLRTLACSAPGSIPEEDNVCSSVLGMVGDGGDTGGCYCRLQYGPHTPVGNREPWDCGGCCPQLTGSYTRDFTSERNLTRLDCLADVFNDSPQRNYCVDRERFASPSPSPAPTSSAPHVAYFVQSWLTLAFSISVSVFIVAP